MRYDVIIYEDYDSKQKLVRIPRHPNHNPFKRSACSSSRSSASTDKPGSSSSPTEKTEGAE